MCLSAQLQLEVISSSAKSNGTAFSANGRNRSAISADVQVQPERDFSVRAERGVVKPACKIVEQCEDDGSSPAWPKQEHRLENPVVSARGVSTKVTLGRTK